MVQTSTARFDIDPFRGWVCLSILVMHFYFGTGSGHLIELSGATVTWCLANLRLGFESFFVLAGFFLAHSFRDNTRQYLSARNFIRRRFLRLLVPYWLVLALAYFNNWVPNVILDHNNPLPTLGEFLAMVFCVQNLLGGTELNFTHWSMPILLQLYFLWAFAFWIVRKIFLFCRIPNFHSRTESALRWGTFVLCMGAFGLLQFGKFEFGKLLTNIPYVGLGVLLYATGVQRRNPALLLILAATDFAFGVITEDSRRFAALFSVIILFAIARGIQFPDSMFTRVLAYYGRRSYSIYLTHATVGYRILNLNNHFEPSQETSILLFFVAVVASLLIADLFYRFVEEPLSKRVREIEYRK